ncbi:MAG: MFS transporter [Alphaproteobacteria bacterium]|nr:MAG: MFS transporter [Alphaproteobacteria bacterium]
MTGRSTGLAALVSMLWLQIANAVTWMTLPVLAPQVAPLAGVEPSTIGHLAGVMFAGALLPTLVAGAAMPLIGPVRMSQLTTALSAAGLLIAATGNVWALLIAALLIGAGYGPGAPLSSAVLAHHTKPEWRGLVFSVRQSGIPIGGLLAGLTLPMVALALGTREAVMVAAAVAFASALMVEPVRQMLDAPLRSAEGPKLGVLVRNVSMRRALSAHPDLPRVTYGGFAAATVQGSVFALLVTFLVERAGLDLVTAGLVFSAMHLSGFVARIAFGYASDRFFRPQSLLASLAAVGVATLLIMLLVAGTVTLPVVIALAAVMGATVSGWNGVMMAELARLSPPGLVASVSASAVTCIYLGYMTGPVVTSGLVGLSGSYLLGFAPVMMALLAAIILAATRHTA